MIVGSTAPGPEATSSDVRGYISNGYMGSTWGGNGITSNVGDFGSGHFALGYAQASAVGIVGNFMGIAVQPTDVIIRFTRYGDSNLDGTVNLIDFNNLAAHFGSTNALWNEGDFNYDSQVNLLDFNLLAQNFGLSAGADGVVDPQDWATLAAAVPSRQPDLAVLAALGLLRRRYSQEILRKPEEIGVHIPTTPMAQYTRC